MIATFLEAANHQDTIERNGIDFFNSLTNCNVSSEHLGNNLVLIQIVFLFPNYFSSFRVFYSGMFEIYTSRCINVFDS
jgi:hypothetical protein